MRRNLEKEKERKVVKALEAFLLTGGTFPHLQSVLYALEEVTGGRFGKIDLPTGGKLWLFDGKPVLYREGERWFTRKSYYWEEFIPVEG